MPIHQLFKDFVIPLIAPVVAIVVPTILFYVIPRRWNRHNLAIALFEGFYGEEMRQARLAAWSHFVTEMRPEDGERRRQRFDLFRAFLTEPEVGRRVDEATHGLLQKTSRVLDYFAIVDGCLARGAVDPNMVRSFLAYYWFWWRQMVLKPLCEKPLPSVTPQHFLPPWWRGLPHLDRACGLEP